MRRTIRYIPLFAVALALACSSMSFNSDWDRDADFPSYSTYAWLEQKTDPASGSAQKAMQQNSLLTKRVRTAVNQHMSQKGFTLDTNNPDLILVFHTGLQDKVNVTDYGYRYSYDYWGWGGRDIDVYQYTEGTLIVDMIDRNTMELVWRGSATGTIDESASNEKREQTIQKAVAGIMENYPPRQR